MKKSIVETVNGLRTFNPATRKEWRKWLAAHHTSTEPVCVVINGKKSKTPNLSYADAVEEALCFGWIDHQGLKRNSESSYLRFSRRKENGNWSMLNVERAERMTREGWMTAAGQVFIDIAKRNGKWAAAFREHVVPTDLKKALGKNKKALKNFQAFPPSTRRRIIFLINSAKQAETRARRIKEAVAGAAKNVRVVQ